MALTAKEVTEIVDRALVKFKEDMDTSLSETLKRELRTIIDEKLETFKEEVNEIVDAKVNPVIQENESLRTELNQLRTELSGVIKEMVLEKIKLLELEVHSRKYNVLVQGIEESTGESELDLMEKFRVILKDVVKLPEDMVQAVSWKAAHRLGKRKDKKDTPDGTPPKPRNSIFVFNHLYIVQEFWRRAKKLGKVAYNFNTHLPMDLAEYRSDLLKLRREMKEAGRVARVWEDKGFPVLEEKVGDDTWIVLQCYKDRFAKYNIQPRRKE